MSKDFAIFLPLSSKKLAISRQCALDKLFDKIERVGLTKIHPWPLQWSANGQSVCVYFSDEFEAAIAKLCI